MSEIDEFLQKVLADQRELQVVPTPREMIDVARNIVTRFRGNIDPYRALDILLAPPHLQEELMRFEERLIDHVRAQRDGSLPDCASSFPLIQEPLTCIIELKPSLKKRTTGRHRSRND